MPKRQKNIVLAPVAVSSAMRRLDRTLREVADKNVGVCLIGESGCGKEVLARRLHDLSPRQAGPFVPINCAAIPEALFESELFGHERGAFTGANQLAHGKLEAADGGTLFLDEVGELPLAMQAKLLRFLEHGRFMRVGGSVKIDLDLRLVCATLRPLEEEVRRGTFRADLFYRIQGITLLVPPLRERREDIPPLVRQLIEEAVARHHVEMPRLTRAAAAALNAYDWPGNVRELRNVVERICILRGGRRVRVSDLPVAVQAHAPLASDVGAVNHSDGTLTIRLDEPLDATIDAIIRAAVSRAKGNRSEAAARLSIGLRTVQRRLASNSGR